MKPFIKIMFISTLAAVSSAQVSAVTYTPGQVGSYGGLDGLDDRLIIAETYSSQGAFAVINGDIQSGTYTSLGAGSYVIQLPSQLGTGGTPGNRVQYGPSGLGLYAGTIRGDVYSGTSTSTGAGAVVYGNISSGGDALNTADGFTSIGAGGTVGGNIHSDGITSTGANATILGTITAPGIALGATNTIGGPQTISAGATAPDVASRDSIIAGHQAYFKANAGGLLGPVTTYATGGFSTFGASDTSFSAGVHNIDDILSFTADWDINLNGDGTDQDWIFNVGNYMVLGANVNVNLNNAGAGSRVIWNVLGDSTGGAGLGYASLGAGVDFIGQILANSYIEVGENYAYVRGANDTCGGLYSKTGYVSVGAKSVVGGTGCSVEVPAPATALLFGLGLGLVGLVGVTRRKKA
jgi:hypothetical protein